ncbi:MULTISPECIES: hypothetical protein [Myxococcus]|uniref:hypothetical protein n=1 Tax=Myxococcus TaxID=32 RepID=UPI0013D7C73C|nr:MULTISPECIES: hypothetical protein [Myxococcus]NVJ24187.1 hypothetical protein [Myxococcus sp. AM011]
MRPAYLRRTFIEIGDGLHFSSPPPPHVAELRNLSSRDPWQVLPCALANLQQGRFEVATRLVHLMHESQDAEVWDACTLMLSFAAPYSVLLQWWVGSLRRLLGPERSPHIQRYFCEVLAHSALTGGVPLLIEIYRGLEDRDVKAQLEVYLSQLLEEQPGPIWKGPREELKSNGLPPPFEESERAFMDAEYLARVEQVYQGLVASERLGPRDALLEGQRLSIRDICRRLLARLRSNEYPDRVELGRMFFETTTGLDCGAFFDESGQLQRLTAAAIVEEFLARDGADTYERGHRYFFGHRIPE